MLRRVRAPRGRHGPALSPMDEIAKAAAMLEKGWITQAHFEKVRNEYLSRL